MMFKKDRQIANQQAMIDNRNKLIEDMQWRLKVTKESNEELSQENEELQKTINEILKRATECPLGSEKIVLAKIKEVISDRKTDNNF